MPVKIATKKAVVTTKTAPAKKTATKAPATKTAARATPRTTPASRKPLPKVKDNPPAPRTRKSTSEKSEKNYTTLQERKESMDPRKKVGGLSYKQLSELTGYGIGTEQFIAAVEIIAGGNTKLDVSHRVAAMLPPTTRNGTPKQISNLVGGVIKNLENRGFTIAGSWKMVPPKA